MSTLIEQISTPDADQKAGLWCYANGWNKEGAAVYNCSTCDDSRKSLLGCGYDPRYSGKCQLRMSEAQQLNGTCPGWWRTRPWVLDVVRMRAWRGSLGHPRDIPAILVDAILLLDGYEFEAEKVRLS